METTNNVQSKSIDLLLDLFVNSKTSLNEESKTNYKRSVPYAFETCDFSSDSERNFLILLPKLLKENRTDDIQQLIYLTRRSVILFDWGSNKKSYKTYINQFLSFIEDNTKTDKIEDLKNSVFTDEEDKNYNLTPEEEKQLYDDFKKKVVVFTHKCLLDKFKSRLRSQERTSGDKIWLPLDYIAKIYRCNDKRNSITRISTEFNDWLGNLTNDIYIHYYKNKKGEIKSIQFGKNQNISLEFSENKQKKGYYDVYVIWGKKPYPVCTPTGVGNKKEPMSVKSISEIDIDHVKPIDLTLRELGNKEGEEGIETLKMVSDSYKEVVKSGKDVNDAIEELLNKDQGFIDNLTGDLIKIKEDSVLRLMSSEYNENKSNRLTYEEILLRQDGTYIGILGQIDKDDEGDRLTIYQDVISNFVPANFRKVKPSIFRKVKPTTANWQKNKKYMTQKGRYSLFL